MNVFSDKVLMTAGEKGSFENAAPERFLNRHHGNQGFSRDEKKQDDMRHLYNNDKLKLYIGVVRDVCWRVYYGNQEVAS